MDVDHIRPVLAMVGPTRNWATPIAAVDSVVGGKRMDALRNTWHIRAIH